MRILKNIILKLPILLLLIYFFNCSTTTLKKDKYNLKDVQYKDYIIYKIPENWTYEITEKNGVINKSVNNELILTVNILTIVHPTDEISYQKMVSDIKNISDSENTDILILENKNVFTESIVDNKATWKIAKHRPPNGLEIALFTLKNSDLGNNMPIVNLLRSEIKKTIFIK